MNAFKELYPWTWPENDFLSQGGRAGVALCVQASAGPRGRLRLLFLVGSRMQLAFCFFAFLLHGDGLDPCLLYNVTNLCP